MMAQSIPRPSFINVGPGRSGTSWLYEMFLAHPEIEMARVKETEFFNTNFERGESWYLQHFPKSARAVGEISNMYYLDPEVPARLAAFDPELKLIFNLRHPRDLLISIIAFAGRRGLDTDDVAAILEAPMGQVMGSGYAHRLAQGQLTPGDTVPVREAVFLSRHIACFQACFPAEQIYFLIYDRIRQAPTELLGEIYGFLGVDPEFRPERVKDVVNQAITPRARWIGRLSSSLGFALRRVGAHGLLDGLKRSRLLKRVLYKERGSPKIAGAERLSIPPALEVELEAEAARLMKMFPELKLNWQEGANVAV